VSGFVKDLLFALVHVSLESKLFVLCIDEESRSPDFKNSRLNFELQNVVHRESLQK
jgi:hypothetical protein